MKKRVCIVAINGEQENPMRVSIDVAESLVARGKAYYISKSSLKAWVKRQVRLSRNKAFLKAIADGNHKSIPAEAVGKNRHGNKKKMYVEVQTAPPVSLNTHKTLYLTHA